jgi:SAM-dependent methyltransferase
MINEIDNIYDRYVRRGKIPGNYYDPLIPWVYMTIQEKERALIRWIKFSGLEPVKNKRVLEIGCGAGMNLLQLVKLGFLPENMVGNELLGERAATAQRLLPSAVQFLIGDASLINFNNNSFDVVLQSMVFTSILDNSFKVSLANHIWAFVRPGGGVLWYDFIYDNPKNPDVRGISIREIRELFPEGEFKVWRVTLAPPISRMITKIHPVLYCVFNSFPILRTHVLCWIKKRD